jgi:aminoglycoside phosphotransferase (APT) family kinase protein
MSEQESREERVRAVLGGWLPEQVPGVSDVRFTRIDWPSAAGFSAETVLVDVDWKRDGQDEHRRLVLRRELRGHNLLHDAELGYQWNVMAALERNGKLGIPTPALIGIEEDESLLGTPFLVMERLPGRIVPQHPNYNAAGWLHDRPAADRHAVWARGIEAMAAVNRLDWRDGFEALARGKTPGLAGFIDWLADWCDWACAGRDHPVARAAIAHLRANMPANPPIEVLWGDPIPANIMYDEAGRVVGLIDWEMAGLGPGEIDLAWWMLFDDLFSAGMHVPRLEGLPSREEVVAIYERALGRPVSDLPYYEILTWLRMTLVSLRAVDRQVALGKFRAENDAWRNNPSARGLAERLGMADAVTVGPDFFEFLQKLMARE